MLQLYFLAVAAFVHSEIVPKDHRASFVDWDSCAAHCHDSDFWTAAVVEFYFVIFLQWNWFAVETD